MSGYLADFDARVRRFFESSPREHFEPGDTIIPPGGMTEHLCYLLEGSVSVVVQGPKGREMVLAYLKAGDFFGEMGMFTGERMRSAAVRARTAAEVARVSYARAKAAVLTDPALLWAMVGQMSIRLRDTTRKLGDLAFRDIAGRLARALNALCEDVAAVRVPGGFQIDVSRTELCRLVGCSPQKMSRALRLLAERELIELRGRKIFVFSDDARRPATA